MMGVKMMGQIAREMGLWEAMLWLSVVYLAISLITKIITSIFTQGPRT